MPLIIAGVNKKERMNKVDEILKKVELERYKEHKLNELSRGQQQRVAIARALVNKPSILLADEITGDLDTHTVDMIMDYLISLNKSENQTIIAITHDIHIG